MPSRKSARGRNAQSRAETEAPQRRTEAAGAETAVAATPKIDPDLMSPNQILQLILTYGNAIIRSVPADILDEILRYCSEQEREYILSILSDNQVIEVLKSYRYNIRKNKEGEYDFPNLRKKVRSCFYDVKCDAENVANMPELDLRVVLTALTGSRPPTNIKKTKLVEMTVLALRAPDARKPDRQEDFQDDFSDVDEIVSVAEDPDTDTKLRGKLFFHCSALTLKNVINKTGAKATESPHRAIIVENAHQLFASIQHLTNDELVNLSKIALFGLARSLGLQVKWANKDDLKALIVNFRNSEEMGGDLPRDPPSSSLPTSPAVASTGEIPVENMPPPEEAGVDGANSFPPHIGAPSTPKNNGQRGRDPTPTQDAVPSRAGQKSTGEVQSSDPRPPSSGEVEDDDRNNITENNVDRRGVNEEGEEDAANTTTPNPQAAFEDDAATFNNGNRNGDNNDFANLARQLVASTRQLAASHIESNRNYQTQFAQGQEQICLLSTRVDQEVEKNRNFRGEMRGKIGEVEARQGQDGARLGKAESDIAGLKGDIDPLQRTVEKLLRKTGVSPASTKRVLFSTDGGGIEQADVDTNGNLAPLTLEVPGSREFVEADKAGEFVALWTEQLTAHRQEVQAIVGDATTLEDVVLCDGIRLSGKSFSNEAAVIIAAFLTAPFMGGRSVASGILNAELDDIIAGRGTEMGLSVLQIICDAFADSNLVDVNLSDNAIGQQGIGACNTVLSKPSLERLALCNNGLSEDTMAEVADILTRDEFGTGCVAANLEKIHFYNNMSGEGGCQHFARILEKSSKLTDIRFASTRAGKDGSDTVASALAAALVEGRNAGLEKLDLCDNDFGNMASQDALFRALRRTPSLKYLDLRDCELEDAGIERVCDALYESNSALEHLDLSGNNVEPSGAERIAYYISNRGGELKVLCLDDNDLTSQGVKDIAFSLMPSGKAIERLQLNNTKCGDECTIALFAVAYDGADGAYLPNLREICLDRNSFTENIVSELECTFGDKLVEMEENDPDGEEGDDAGEDEDGGVDAVTSAMGNLWN